MNLLAMLEKRMPPAVPDGAAKYYTFDSDPVAATQAAKPAETYVERMSQARQQRVLDEIRESMKKPAKKGDEFAMARYKANREASLMANRAKILAAVLSGSSTGNDIAKKTGVCLSTVFSHCHVLTATGQIEGRVIKGGGHRFYPIAKADGAAK